MKAVCIYQSLTIYLQTAVLGPWENRFQLLVWNISVCKNTSQNFFPLKKIIINWCLPNALSCNIKAGEGLDWGGKNTPTKGQRIEARSGDRPLPSSLFQGIGWVWGQVDQGEPRLCPSSRWSWMATPPTYGSSIRHWGGCLNPIISFNPHYTLAKQALIIMPILQTELEMQRALATCPKPCSCGAGFQYRYFELCNIVD